MAIKLDRKGLEAMTFTPDQEDRVLTWLANVDEQHNVYFTVNPVSRVLVTKPSRKDIREMGWLHVDVDPRVGEDLGAERTKILAKLQAHEPKPSCIIFSGGGYQGFWRLREPFRVDGQEALYKEAARYNLQLELVLGGDSCHNVDRIMRLPGTVNRPDEKKRAKGRTEELAKVVHQEDSTYDLRQFTPAPQVQSAGADLGGTGTVKVSGNVQRVVELNDLPVGDLVKRVIAQGTDPDDPTKWQSRSEPLFWVCCEMVRAGVDDDTIYAVITDPVWNISSSVLDKGSNVHSYAVRQIERAREEAINPILRELNERHAVTMLAGKTRVIRELVDVVDGNGTMRTRIDFVTFGDFENFYRNRFVSIPTGSGKPPIEIPAGKWWLSNPLRRQYDRVVFAPGMELPGTYNLWKGFAHEARPGDGHLPFLAHVRDNICRGEERLFTYLERWMALCCQRPAQPGHVAVVLRGREGTGKGVFANMFGALFGRHFLAVRDPSHLFGNFNAHIEDCLVLFADEAFWAGDKKREGMLKSLITEQHMMYERKGYEAGMGRNYVHLIMASNEDWVVPAGSDARRFLVLDVGEDHMRDTPYFAEIERSMREGGHENLLHHLLTLDLSEFNVRAVPATAALMEQKQHSFPPDTEWWYGKLRDGRIDPTKDGWPETAWASELCHDFVSYLKCWAAGSRSNETRLGLHMRRVLPKMERVQIPGEHNVRQVDGEWRTVTRPHAYLLPSLDECRRHFDRNFGGPFQWEPEMVQKESAPSEPRVF